MAQEIKGLLRNIFFCHPDTEHFGFAQCKLREGEGSIHSRDSSSFGLRMTSNCVFRDSPLRQKCFNVFDQISLYWFYLLVLIIPLSAAGIELVFSPLLLSFIIKKALKPDFNFLKNPVNLFLLLFMAFSSLSLINSGQYLEKSLKALFLKWLEYALIFIMAQDILSKPKRVKNSSWVLIATAVVVCFSAFSQKFLGVEFIAHRPVWSISGGFVGVTGPFKHYNDLGAYLIVIIFSALGMFFSLKQKTLKTILFSLVILFLACFTLTFSRGAFLGLLVSLILMLVFSKRFTVLLFFLAAIIFFLFFFGVNDRVMSSFVFGVDSERFASWKGAWGMIKENPFLGKGLGTFMDYFTEYTSGLPARYAHNCYLQIWAESGIFSLIAFILFAGSALYFGFIKFLKNCDFLLLGLLAGVFGFLAHCFFDTHLYSLKLAVLFWVALGLIVGATAGARK